MKLIGVQIGNYDSAAMRYIKKVMRRADNISKERLSITHASCSTRLISKIKETTARICNFEETIIINASATVSSNCGKNTFGVIFERE